MHTLLQYCTPRIDPVLINTVKRNEKLYLLRPARTAAGGRPAHTVASAEIAGLSDIVGWVPGWEALRSNPVINGAARQ